MSVTTLYRFYNSNDELLYVGISEKGPERWKAHRKDKPWWTDVARTTTEHYDTRTDALDAERAAIIAEKPKHNIVHNGDCRTSTRSVRSRSSRAPSTTEEWAVTTHCGHTRTSSLWFYWEIAGDPITDDYTPDDAPVDELFWMWVRKRRGSDPNDKSIPIYWYIEGSAGIFEYAPGAPNAAEWGDFRQHYKQPFHVTTGVLMVPEMIPVADKHWNSKQSTKGGFIQEATGWKPYLYQPSMSLNSLVALAVKREES